MKVLVAQTNTTPRDFEGNVAQIVFAIDEAEAKGADLVVTPELSIPGYLCRDLVYNDVFIENNLKALQLVLAQSAKHPQITVVVGYVSRNTTGVGKPFRNTAVAVRNGCVIATYNKHLLPFYDVFDEGRYFQPGNELAVIDICGEKWGIAICEDVWNDKNVDDYNYKTNPLQMYRDIGVNNIIAVNSSPYTITKPKTRIKMLRESFQTGRIIYVNQIGGQDDLVFDGHSLIIDHSKILYSEMTSLEPTYRVVDLNDRNFSTCPTFMPQGDYIAELWNMSLLGLRDYIKKSGFKKVVFGSSGGIDSAVVAALCCEAFGPENVFGIRMPSVYSSQHSLDDALQLHQNLGCHDLLVPIEHESLIEKYNGVFLANSVLKEMKYADVADQNLQARIRGSIVMHFSNAFGALAITTGNKSELSVGYCTIFGDMCGGFAAISDIFKMDVYRLAEYYNSIAKGKKIPQNIIDKKPSAELKPGQFDEDNLLPYPILDPILEACIEHCITDSRSFVKWIDKKIETTEGELQFRKYRIVKEWAKTAGSEADYNRMIRLTDISEFKRRQMAIGTKTSPIAFGTGRRLPVVKR